MKIWGEKNSTKQNRQNASLTKQKLNQINRNCRVPWRAAKERDFQQRMLCHQLRKDEVVSLQPPLEGGWCGDRGSKAISGSVENTRTFPKTQVDKLLLPVLSSHSCL